MRSQEEAALWYAAQGFRVFPLEPGTKTPFKGFHWRELATADRDTVQQWWQQCPEANIAVVGGPESGLTVLDYDVKDDKPGLQTAADVHGPGWWDRLPHVRTPSGGVHVYMTHQPAWENRKLNKLGLDVQGDGAYVVAPPGLLWGEQDGEYEWRNADTGFALVEPDERCLKAMEQLLARDGGEDRGARLPFPEDWQTAGFPDTVDGFMTGKVASFWFDGDLGEYQSRSEAVAGCALRLMGGAGFSPRQALAAMCQNDWCWDTATSDGRRTEGGRSAAMWLWKYAVLPMVPRNPFAQAEAATGAAVVEEAAPVSDEAWAVAAGFQSPQDALAPPQTTPYDDAMAAADRLDYGDMAGLDEVLRGLAVMELMPHHEDAVLTRAADKVGANRSALRASLKHMKATHAREQAEAKADMRRGEGLGSRYVYVENLDRVFNLVERTLVTPTAFGNMHGADVREDYIQGGLLRRVGQVTYWPQNAWAPGFNRNDHDSWLYVTDLTTGEKRLNLWQPPRTTPRLDATDEDVAPWLRHLDNLGLPTEEREHLINYLAFVAQHPEQKVNHMLVLGGYSGSGKDLALVPLQAALGPENIKHTRHNELASDFDPDVRNAKVLMVAELASSNWNRQDAHRMYNHLKPYAAAPPSTLSVTLKGLNSIAVPNIVQVIAQTNYRDALVLDKDDRRVAMLWCDGAPVSQEYADDMWAWMEGGGAELVAGWLLTRDLEAFNPKARPPMSAWKAEALESSLSEMAQHVLAVREESDVTGEPHRLAFDLVAFSDLQQACAGHALMHGDKRDVTQQRLTYALDQLQFPRHRVKLSGKGQQAGGRDTRRRETLVVWRRPGDWRGKDLSELAAAWEAWIDLE